MRQTSLTIAFVVMIGLISPGQVALGQEAVTQAVQPPTGAGTGSGQTPAAHAPAPQSGGVQPSKPVQTATNTKPSARMVAPADSDYVIGTDDVIYISVWKEAELSRQVVVRPDGKISFPLIGQVKAEGKTPLLLQHQITDLLEPFLASPEVTVIMQSTRSQRINIVGSVMRPGTYPLTKPMTILDALAVAGGFTDFAKPSKAYIMRTYPTGAHQRIDVNCKKIMKKADPKQNIELQAKDIIVVP